MKLQPPLIILFWGPMFSGKSERMLTFLLGLKHGRRTFIAFRSSRDDREDEEELISRNGFRTPAIVIGRDPWEMLDHVRDQEVVGIDEVQFFDREIVDVVIELARRGKTVVMAGLDTKFDGTPFDTPMRLAAIATESIKCHAHCDFCEVGLHTATRSFRLSRNTDDVETGHAYVPLCFDCFERAMELRRRGEDPMRLRRNGASAC